MSKRRPVGYAAGALIDAALMANSQALRALRPLMDGREKTTEERYRLIGLAIHEIHESSAALREIPQAAREA